MKVRFKVDKDLCIPAMSCIVAEPDLYFLDENGKADIPLEIKIENIKRLASTGEGWVEVETDDAGLERLVNSAKICPVLAIFVEVCDESKGDWKRIYPE